MVQNVPKCSFDLSQATSGAVGQLISELTQTCQSIFLTAYNHREQVILETLSGLIARLSFSGVGIELPGGNARSTTEALTAFMGNQSIALDVGEFTSFVHLRKQLKSSCRVPFVMQIKELIFRAIFQQIVRGFCAESNIATVTLFVTEEVCLYSVISG